jgi:acyl phosphate:glycerol-3-phosphate acyltransferase
LIQRSEYFRKIIHIFNLVIPFTYLFFLESRFQALRILVPLTLFAIVLEYLRVRSAVIKKIFNNFLKSMLRIHEMDGKYTGATWIFISSTLTIAIFPKEIAIISLVYMSLGDTIAGLVGRKFGKTKFYNKSIEGSLAGLIVCLLSGYLVNLTLPLVVVFSGAFAAMFIELLPMPIDDNLSVPLFAGTIMVITSTVVI